MGNTKAQNRAADSGERENNAREVMKQAAGGAQHGKGWCMGTADK